jgi:hypothetical protein
MRVHRSGAPGRSRGTALAAALGWALFAAPAAEARRGWRAGARGGAGIVWDAGYEAFSEGDGMARFGFVVETPILPRDDLALEFGYEFGASAAPLHAAGGAGFAAALLTHGLDATVAWRYDLPWNLRFAPRAGLELMFANATVAAPPGSVDPALTAWSVRPGARAALGIEWAPSADQPSAPTVTGMGATPKPGAALGAVFALEAGWLLLWPHAFDLAPAPTPDDDPKKRLPWLGASTGTLDLGGPFVRLVITFGE